MGAAKDMSGILTLKITVDKGPDKLGTLSFESAVVKIGRGEENDIALSSDPRVSRYHAEIQQHGTDFFVVNVSQKNFLLVNNVQADREKLSSGDRIQIGDTILKIDYHKPTADLPIPTEDFDKTSAKPVSLPPRPGANEVKSFDFGNLAVPPPKHPQAPPPRPQGVSGGLGQYNSYQTPGYGAGSPSSSAGYRPPVSSNSGRIRFYTIIAVVALIGYWFFSGGTKAKKDPNAIKDTTQILKELQESQESIGRLKKENERNNSTAYVRAQENLVRALRDFNQGQFGRALEGFQLVLNLDPSNEMARRYYNLSRTRLDQQIKDLMLQGARYKEKGNWRLCADAFSKAMIFLQGRRDDPSYKQAQRFEEECRLQMQGRY